MMSAMDESGENVYVHTNIKRQGKLPLRCKQKQHKQTRRDFVR